MNDNNKDLSTEIIMSEQPIKDLTYLFNEAQIKQSMLRAEKVSRLYDKVVDKIEHRIDTKSDNFTNAELLNAINVLQKSTDSTLTYINSINEKPQVQLVSNNVNVNIDNNQLPKESRDRIMSAASALLEMLNQNDDNTSNDEYLDLTIDNEDNTNHEI